MSASLVSLVETAFMPRPQHFYGQNHLHYLTANIYRKARIFDSERYKRKFIQTLDDLRTELRFKIIGYVLIPQGGTVTC
jgi:REP element-mobilizing transposase RayT